MTDAATTPSDSPLDRLTEAVDPTTPHPLVYLDEGAERGDTGWGVVGVGLTARPCATRWPRRTTSAPWSSGTPTRSGPGSSAPWSITSTPRTTRSGSSSLETALTRLRDDGVRAALAGDPVEAVSSLAPAGPAGESMPA
jgi:hypothetical protein